MDDGTLLKRLRGIQNNVSADEYLRMIAISRIMLPNIKNIQASWLTVGKETAQLCLHGGANDFGSIMIEENVVSAAGHHTASLTKVYKNLSEKQDLNHSLEAKTTALEIFQKVLKSN